MPKKVLLIEYEPRYVERVRNLLTPHGHVLTEAHDGEAGLQAFGASRFDLILLSGMLPRLPSAEVIREIRKKGGATAPPIILMMSGYKGTNRKADAQKVGAFDILLRPFSDEDFMVSVQDAVDATDMGAKTMRIDTAQVAAAMSPLTSSDIFSDVLDDLTGEAPDPKAPAPAPPAAAPAAPAPAASAPAAAKVPPPENDMDKRLRDTLSGLMSSRPMGASGPAARSDKTALSATPSTPGPPQRQKLSSDTDVDKILSDTLSGVLSRPKPPASAAPAPSFAAPAAPSAPRKREEPAAAVASSGPDHFGQYEILERIASGGMAELYKAKRTGVEGFQKIVAIKKILPHLADDEEFVTMFADEAKLAAQLNHPNIIHIYDLGKIQAGGYFIAMEYVDGRDLRAIQQAGREMSTPIPVPLAVYVASKVASALDYAHRRRDAEGHELNIVHRDVSPQNILISYEGDIKLCDFGIAKAASKASKTQSGALKGKIQYMSPEQAWGKPIDRRSDLFSLGVVLHELLTGERLFVGDTDINILEKVRVADVPPPSRGNPEVPHNLDAVVLKALAREPDDRYSNASDLLRDLDSVLYSYTPAPGSADVAIYLHRLQAEEGAVEEAKAREVAQAAHEAEPAARKRKSKGAPVPRKTGATPRPPAPADAAPPSPPPPVAPPPPVREPSRPTPGVFGSLEKSAEAESSRTPLVIGVAAAAVALAAFLAWKFMKPQAAGPSIAAPNPTPAPTAVAVATAAAAAPASTPAAAGIDPKTVEAEVQRQLATRRKELEKTAVAGAKAPAAAAVPVMAATAPPEPTAEPTIPPTAVPVPTAVPTEPPAPTVEAPKPAPEPELRRGDLVGPGVGVIEPTLVSPPRVVYPPIARQQRVEGRVVVLVLVDENGNAVEARLQQGLQAAINDAVLTAVRGAKFRAATKNGVPVKMWRPIIVDVKP